MQAEQLGRTGEIVVAVREGGPDPLCLERAHALRERPVIEKGRFGRRPLRTAPRPGGPDGCSHRRSS